MCQNKRNKLSFATLILYKISLINFWSVQERISARLPTLQEDVS